MSLKPVKLTAPKFSFKIGNTHTHRLPKKVKEQIYYKTVTPCITSYCIAVWGNCCPALFDKIENIHARAAKVIYKLPSEFPNIMNKVWQWQIGNHCHTFIKGGYYQLCIRSIMTISNQISKTYSSRKNIMVMTLGKKYNLRSRDVHVNQRMAETA